MTPTSYRASLTTPTRVDFNCKDIPSFIFVTLESSSLCRSGTFLSREYVNRGTPLRTLSPGVTLHDVILAEEVEDRKSDCRGASFVGSESIPVICEDECWLNWTKTTKQVSLVMKKTRFIKRLVVTIMLQSIKLTSNQFLTRLIN